MSDDSVVSIPDGVAGGVIRAGDLQLWLDTMSSIVSEARIRFSDDGWTASAVDPGNVAMLHDVRLAPRGFEHFDSPGSATIGVYLETLDDRLGPANADDLVEFSLDMEARKLHVRIRNIVQSIALIDPDAIRNDPDEPELDLSNELVIEGRDFAEAVDVIDDMTKASDGNALTIAGEPDKRRTVFRGEGDVDETIVGFGDAEAIDASVDEAKESMFSSDYLSDMVAPIPDDAEVTLRWGQEFPLRYTYDALDGALDVTAMLAPRVQSN